jgi:hypothetical protein
LVETQQSVLLLDIASEAIVDIPGAAAAAPLFRLAGDYIGRDDRRGNDATH